MNMTYEEFVADRCKPGDQIELSANDKHLIHMVLGLQGEIGELVDCFKRHWIYGQPLDMDNLSEEIGDCEFYLAGIRNGLIPLGGVDRDTILAQNVAKLVMRYPNGYTNQAAAERADKGGAG